MLFVFLIWALALSKATSLLLCWPSFIRCGSSCCATGGDYCADSTTSTCCSPGTSLVYDVQGKTRLCCSETQYNAGGICCESYESACMGSCCAGTCEFSITPMGETMEICQATGSGCINLGGTGQLCSADADCGSGGCRWGCCIATIIN